MGCWQLCPLPCLFFIYLASWRLNGKVNSSRTWAAGSSVHFRAYSPSTSRAGDFNDEYDRLTLATAG
ncbi:hypothetical protein J6590_078075 [Homalodisca vitripennis]|nr:hypothetical protein J6590_078075 [Homalodisca vitripennis]